MASLRLDALTEAKIRRLVRETGRSKSAVVREAMAQYDVGREPDGGGRPSALDRMRPFLGVIGSGGADLSVNTHAKYGAKLRTRRGRHAR